MTFTAKQACIALDVPRGTLNWWVSQGLTRDFRSTETTPGKARRFPLSAVVMLAVMKRLTESGLAALPAQEWARFAVRYFDASPQTREFSVYFTSTDTVVFPEMAGERPPVDAHSRLTIYPTVTMDEMKERLKAAGQQLPVPKRGKRSK